MTPSAAPCYSKLEQVLRANLSEVDVDDSLLHDLRAAYGGGPDLSDEDISLIGVAVVKSNSTAKVGLLSHDEDLLDGAHKIRSCRQIVHGGSTLSTLHIDPEYGLTFFSLIHECCEIETPAFAGLVTSVSSADLYRWEQQKLRSVKKVTRKLRTVYSIWQAIAGSSARKERNRLSGAAA